MKEVWTKNRDTILVALLVVGLAGFVFEGGRFLLSVLKWPIIVALVVGLFFGVGNDGYHAAKRLVRDKVVPWLRTLFK